MNEILISFAIPSAVTGFFFWLLKGYLDKKDAILQEREKTREKSQLYLINTVNASLALGEATARAVQRIPDAKCNGDMHEALDYAKRVKNEQKDFINEQAIKKMY